MLTNFDLSQLLSDNSSVLNTENNKEITAAIVESVLQVLHAAVENIEDTSKANAKVLVCSEVASCLSTLAGVRNGKSN